MTLKRSWASAYVDVSAELPELDFVETASSEVEFLRLLALARADDSARVWHRLIWRLAQHGNGPMSLRISGATGPEDLWQ